jgi:four helix bundle protein
VKTEDMERHPKNSSNALVRESFKLALASINYCTLLDSRKKYIVANQLLRCSTSVGANISEAQHAESRQDFIHKLKIAAKELEETKYWLYLCEEAEDFPDPTDVHVQTVPVSKLLNSILATCKKRV